MSLPTETGNRSNLESLNGSMIPERVKEHKTMVIRRPLRPVKPEHIIVTPEGEQATLPTTPIEYAITPRGQGAYLPDKGKFREGEDPRRHKFTPEECRKGFQNAVESLLRRYPNCDPHFWLCRVMGSRPWHKLPEVLRLLARDEPLTEAEVHHQFARG